MDNAICHRLQTYTWPTARPSKAMIIAETALSLSWVMLLKIICEHRILNSRTMEIYDYTWDGAYVVMDDGCYLKLFAKYAWATTSPLESMIIADTVFPWSWTMFEIVREKVHVYMADSRTVEIYDYVWDGAHNVMDDAIWNRLQKHAWPTPGPSNPWL